MIELVTTYLIVPMLVMNLATLNIDYKYTQVSSKYEKKMIVNEEGKATLIQKMIKGSEEDRSSVDGSYEQEEDSMQDEREDDENNGQREGEAEENNNHEGSGEIEEGDGEENEGEEKEEDDSQEGSGEREEGDGEENEGEEKEEEDNSEEGSGEIEEGDGEENEGEEKEEEDNNQEGSEEIEEGDGEENEGKEKEEDNSDEGSKEIEEGDGKENEGEEKEEDDSQEGSGETEEGNGEENEGEEKEEDNSHEGNGETGEGDGEEKEEAGEVDEPVTDPNENKIEMPHIINEGYILEDDYEVTDSVYLNGGTLNLNGNTLTIRGNLYHEGGKLRVNNGELIIEGNYYLCKISGDAGNENIERGEGKLELTKSSEVLDIEGDFIIKTKNYENEDLREATIYLAGDFFYSPASQAKALQLSGNLKLVLVGAGEQQTITDTIHACNIGTLIIRGRADRIINFKVDYSKIVINRLEVQSPVQFKTSKKNNFNISYARIEEDLLINGDIQTSYTCDVVNSHLTINGNLTNTREFYLKKSKVEVLGDLVMKYNATLNIDDTESEINVSDNLEIKSMGKIEVTNGKLVIGKNLIQTEQKGLFVTGGTVEVILLGDVEEGETVKIQGQGITLGRVYLEGPLEKYEFNENVHYTLADDI